MSTKYIASNWRLPNQENSSKSDNYGLTFDGSGLEYINFGTDVLVDSTSSFSISVWCYINDYNTIQFPGIGRFKTDQSTGFFFGVSNNPAYAGVYFGSSSNFVLGKTSGDISGDFIGQWKHITIVFDGVSRTTLSSYKVYVDGSEVSNTTVAGFNPVANENRLGEGNGTGTYLDGKLSEVAIFDYALTESQISTLYGSSSLGAGNPMALKPQPVAYYPLGDNSASNPLTQPNEAVADASVFDFSGSSQYVDCGSPSVFDNLNSFTISCWFNSDLKSQDRGILGKWLSGTDRSFALNLETSGNIRFVVRNSSQTAASTYINTSDWSTGNWYNVIGVYDGTNVKVYLDGVLKDTASLTGTVLNTTHPFRIGKYHSSIPTFSGKISNVAIWNSDQSLEKDNIYNSGVPATTYTNTPTAWYKLDQSANWEADSSGDWQIPDNRSAYPQSFSFDGVDDNISISQINLGTSNTISLWYKSNGKTPNYFTLLGNDDAPNDYAIWVQSGITIWYKVQDALNGNINWNVTSVNDDKWHNFIFARTDTTINFYIDGNLQTVNNNTLANNDTKIDTIGAKTNNTDNFKGELSNIQFWNNDLSSSAETLYNNGTPLTTAIATDNLKLWAKLDNTATWTGSAYSIPDASGNGNTGTSSGMTEQNLVNNNVSALNGESSGMTSASLVLSDLTRAVPYGDGYSFNFDSISGDYIDCGDSDTFSFGNDSTDEAFSVSAWIKMDTITNFVVLSKYGASASLREYAIGFSPDKIYILLYDDNGAYRGRYYNTSTTSNDWLHIATTYNGVGGTNAQDGIKIYINGERVDDQTYTSGLYTAMSNTTSELRIGSFGTTYADGKISNVSLFNQELTSTEVMKLYSNGVPQDLTNFTPAPPVAWWPLGSNSFWNGSQWTVRDMIGSNDGTGQNIGIDGLVGDSPRSSANGVGTNNSIPENLTGSTKWSDNNSWSINMSSTARVEDTP